MDNNLSTTALFMDLSKAFDCVDHSILLFKMEKAGIRENALKLMTSYLTNRQICVKVNGKISEPIIVNSSVPQGSCLGPLLYLMYVNDFGYLNLHGKPKLFADDTTIFYSNGTIQDNISCLNHDFIIMSEYFRINKLTLNINKTKAIHFSKKQQ